MFHELTRAYGTSAASAVAGHDVIIAVYGATFIRARHVDNQSRLQWTEWYHDSCRFIALITIDDHSE